MVKDTVCAGSPSFFLVALRCWHFSHRPALWRNYRAVWAGCPCPRFQHSQVGRQRRRRVGNESILCHAGVLIQRVSACLSSPCRVQPQWDHTWLLINCHCCKLEKKITAPVFRLDQNLFSKPVHRMSWALSSADSDSFIFTLCFTVVLTTNVASYQGSII